MLHSQNAQGKGVLLPAIVLIQHLLEYRVIRGGHSEQGHGRFQLHAVNAAEHGHRVTAP